VSVVGAFGGIAGWIKTKVNFSSFRKTTTDAQAQASAKMDELQKISAQKDLTIQSATTRAETAEAKAAQYESEFQNYKTVLDGKDMEIERLKSQIDGLSKQNVDKLAEQVSDQVVEKTRIG
jgi:chromosome segregation ATPase